MSGGLDGYEVTADGRVFSVTSNWRGYGKRELCQQLNSHGYPSVRLMIAGKRKRYCVHWLVAKAFLSDRPTPSHEIRHLDGNKQNNNSWNLEWGTRKENADDREKHGKTSRGERHSRSIKLGIKAKKQRLSGGES